MNIQQQAEKEQQIRRAIFDAILNFNQPASFAEIRDFVRGYPRKRYAISDDDVLQQLISLKSRDVLFQDTDFKFDIA